MLSRILKSNSVVVRKLLGLYYRSGRAYQIPFGPFRGLKLVFQPDVNFHAMLGIWELEQFAAFQCVSDHSAWRGQDGLILDVGGNIGLFALWFARRLAPNGRVVSFEPAPHTFKMLQDNLRANGVENATLEKMACADRSGTVDFYEGFHHHTSSMDRSWAAGGKVEPRKLTVPSIALDDYVGNLYGQPRLRLIKMDIEGGAVFALPGCRKILRQQRPPVVIESHNPREDAAVSACLLEHQYAAYRVNDRQWVAHPDQTYPDLQGVWGTLLLVPKEHQAEAARLLAR